ncbi:MAG: hypothetical protein J0G32_07270 [Alphaproteobacteria bacterium]|nr:hypothetical protein [Alphaproteobacteria bacterium]OJV15711.1 MAG: hypothetical protein BGO27_07325 [Alphaproteobacteria bacterium 33-17]
MQQKENVLPHLLGQVGNEVNALQTTKIIPKGKFAQIRHHLAHAGHCFNLMTKFGLNGKVIKSKTVSQFINNKQSFIDELNSVADNAVIEQEGRNQIRQNQLDNFNSENRVIIDEITKSYDEFHNQYNNLKSSENVRSIITDLTNLQTSTEVKSLKDIQNTVSKVGIVQKDMESVVKQQKMMQKLTRNYLYRNFTHHIKEVLHIIKEAIVGIFHKNPKDNKVKQLNEVAGSLENIIDVAETQQKKANQTDLENGINLNVNKPDKTQSSAFIK